MMICKSHTNSMWSGIRYGDFYARHLIESLDLQKQEGPVRVSMVHYNTIDEVEKLIQAFDKIF